MYVDSTMVFETIKKSTEKRVWLDDYVKDAGINVRNFKRNLYNRFKVDLDEHLINLMIAYYGIKISEFAKMIADQINSESQFTTNDNYKSDTSFQIKDYKTSTYNNATDNYPQMKKSTDVVSSKQVSIPINIQLANELKNLSNEISNGQNELQKILNSLDTSSLEITIKRNWWGTINKDSIVESVEKVYTNLGYYIGKCGNALQQTNENLGRTLELIKLLALVEKELYEQVGNQTISNNELKTIIYDWLKNQGIRDEEVQELLETSLKRAYTLRDRLNALRQENKESIACIESQMTALKSRLNNLQDDHKRSIARIEDKMADVRHNLFDRLTQLDCQTKDDLRKRLNKLQEEHKGIFTHLEERITALEKKQSNNNEKKQSYNNVETPKSSSNNVVIWTLIGSAIISGIVSYLITAII